MVSEDWIHYILGKKKNPIGFSDLSAFFKYVVYLFKDLAKRIKMLFLTVTSQALIIPIFDLLAVDLELNSLAFMWVVAFKKKSHFQLVDLKMFFSPTWTAWVERGKKALVTVFLFSWEADGQFFGNVWSVLCHPDRENAGRVLRGAQGRQT